MKREERPPPRRVNLIADLKGAAFANVRSCGARLQAFLRVQPFYRREDLLPSLGVPKQFSIFGESRAHPSTYYQNGILVHVSRVVPATHRLLKK